MVSIEYRHHICWIIAGPDSINKTGFFVFIFIEIVELGDWALVNLRYQGDIHFLSWYNIIRDTWCFWRIITSIMFLIVLTIGAGFAHYRLLRKVWKVISNLIFIIRSIKLLPRWSPTTTGIFVLRILFGSKLHTFLIDHFFFSFVRLHFVLAFDTTNCLRLTKRKGMS